MRRDYEIKRVSNNIKKQKKMLKKHHAAGRGRMNEKKRVETVESDEEANAHSWDVGRPLGWRVSGQCSGRLNSVTRGGAGAGRGRWASACENRK